MKQEELRSWSIAELAKLSRVSSRTLRHYDQVGLLPPAYTGHNGYRHYTQPELLRLQRILLLRELGLGLETIGQVLDGQADQLGALNVHPEVAAGRARPPGPHGPDRRRHHIGTAARRRHVRRGNLQGL
jgi:DNA-binding transcriptional MerR regulator